MKKNLVGMLKSSFVRKMAFLLAVFVVALASNSCKHDKGGGGEPKPKVEKVTLTFEKGEHVKKVEPNSIEVEKGKAIKLSELKKKINVECDAEYEADKFFYGAGKNIEIKEDGAFKPNENINVYITAKKKGSAPDPQPGNVALASVKVGGNQVAVIDEMDAGAKTEAEVDVEFTTTPEDAKISFAPKLKEYDETTKKGIWALNMGENSIKITVSKDTKTKEYTLKIKRVKEDEAILEYLKIDDVSITLQEDPQTMVVGNTEKEKVKVEYASNQGSAVVTTPSIASGAEWDLAYGKNTLKFKVEKGSNVKNYTLEITRDKIAPKITSITIGPHKKDGAGIIKHNDDDANIIEIPLPFDKSGVEYEIKVEHDMPGAQVEYDSEDPILKISLVQNKVKFVVNDNIEKIFTIKVKKDDVESSYKVKVLMMTDAAGFNAARYMGENSSPSLDIVKKVLRHENVTMTMYGDVVAIAVGSKVATWETIRINNEDAKISLGPNTGFQSYGRRFLPLTLGESTEVEIIVSNSEWENDGPKEPHLATEVFKFTINCSPNKADAFIEKVLVDDKVITGDDVDDGPFMALFDDDSIEEISSGNPATIDVVLSRKVKSVKIGDVTINEADLKGGVDEGVNVYHAKVENIAVPASGKEITIVVTPKDEDANYRVTTMRMKLSSASQNKPQLLPTWYVCEINGTNISRDFRAALEEGKNPLYTVDLNRIMMKMEFQAKPKKVTMDVAGNKTSIEGDDIDEIDFYGSFRYYAYIDAPIDNTEKQITLTFEPDDTTKNSTGEWRFRIKGTNDKPKLKPVFAEISKDTDLKDFMDKLEKKLVPTYKVNGTEANIVISLTEDEYDFLLQQKDGVKVNNVLATKEEFAFDGDKHPKLWKLKKTIPNLSATPTDVKVEFLARAGVADNVVWNFKLETGGDKPCVPSVFLKFGINNYGSEGISFTDDFIQAMKYGPIPTLELYGKDVKIYFSSYFKEYLKEVKFKIDSEAEIVKQAEGDYSVRAEHTFENLAKDSEHTITVTAIPTSQDYKETEYKVKLKIMSELEVPRDYEFSVDGTERPHGYKATLERDFAMLEFRVYGDLVEEVKMGKEGALNKIDLVPFPTTSGRKIYIAKCEIDLRTDEEHDNWVMEVTPKEKDKYPVVKWKYILNGKVKTDENNASFVLGGNNRPSVKPTVIRRAGINSTGIEDYGAIKVNFEAYTMAKESSVKAIRIHTLKDTDMHGEAFKLFDRVSGSRKVTGSMDAYDDKPTKIKLWVIAKDGSTQDEIGGMYKLNINPVPLWWSYRNIKNTDKAKPDYAEIKISKTKVKKDGKIYVFFAPFKEWYGFKVSRDVVSEGQTELEKLEQSFGVQDVFRTSLDVKNMKVGETKEVWCKLVHKDSGIEGLTYKVKVVMEN